MTSKRTSPGDRSALADRCAVGARVIAAGIGGYALSNIGAAAIAEVLPMPRADAVMAAILSTFAIYAAAIVWAFATRSALRACVSIAACVVLSALVLAVAGQGGG